ncbi:hypothetical protein EJ08DRAFT_630152 [Tothia fuscella]|uniref:DUF6594 domain-containing protein n=1 Tax=Tothia fuscella TaxID=1048955 RepID=A0A9P4U0U2_9PEZI|nr:hypothetical protein EJ08DRAFT_630152 [Tothia fuscella]
MSSTPSALEKGVAREDSARDLTVGSCSPITITPSSRRYSTWSSISSLLKRRPSTNAGAGPARTDTSVWLGARTWFRGTRPETRVRGLSACPRGYPNVAAFLDSDENFMVYRRFGYIQSRLLLNKQDELRELEESLDLYDQRQFRTQPLDVMTRSDLAGTDAKDRQQLFEKLEHRFCSYANLISSAQQLVALNRPAKSDFMSVYNYMNKNQPLKEEEQEWIKCREDLVTLRPGREHAWLDASLEHLLKYLNEMGTGRTDAVCLGTLLVFTLAFSAVLSLFTRARRHEILGAAAAYCAVLVVFLGNVSNNQLSNERTGGP